MTLSREQTMALPELHVRHGITTDPWAEGWTLSMAEKSIVYRGGNAYAHYTLPSGIKEYAKAALAASHLAALDEVERLRAALDVAFHIVRKTAVAAKMDVVNASPGDPTALQREKWMLKCDAALEQVVAALEDRT